MRQGMIVSAAVIVLAAVVVMIAVKVGAQESATAPAPVEATVPITPAAAIAQGKLEDALDAVESARVALSRGNNAAVQTALDEARDLMTGIQPLLEEAKFANTRCPILGTPIDPAEEPQSRTRLYRGHVVAFCTDQCPAKWDSLSEAEKEAKLAMASGAEAARAEIKNQVVNGFCPVDGRRVDQISVPSSLIRMHRGQPVGFDKFSCRRTWDRMTLGQRDSALQQVLAYTDTIVNTVCPIDGHRVDPAKVLPSQIRWFRGRLIGFDSYLCRQTWDRLDSVQREAKIRAVVPDWGRVSAPTSPPPPRGY